MLLEDCNCAPGFHNEGGEDAMEVSVFGRKNFAMFYCLFQTYEVCTGAQLACSNEILNRMGQFNKERNVEQNM